MSALESLSIGAEVPCPPCGRRHLPHFQGLRAALAADPATALLALWADATDMLALLRDERTGRVALASCPVAGFVALDGVRPAAAWFQRAIRDLWGHALPGAADTRPWLDHGAWEQPHPLSGRAAPPQAAPPPFEFLPAAGSGLTQIPVGPVHAGIIEPGHFRFHAQGETVVRLEVRLGYAHKGTLGLMRGKSPRAAARYAARLSGDSTVAHALAFARAAEAAAGTAPPPRALALRQAMLELERIANHCGDCGAIINDCAFVALAAVLQDWRERMLRACAAAFGHRLMMDAVIPGGVAIDIAGGGVPAILAVLEGLQDALPGILRVIDSHASLLDRLVGTGVIAREVAHRFAAPGVAGRACGRARDTRGAEWPDLPVPARTEGDVDARLRVRLEELGTSAALLRLILADLPDGALAVPMEPAAGEGLGVAEGFRGECWHWLRLDGGGQISAAFAADPSWRLWPLLEHAAMGNIVADFPLINKSLNASYSGVDL